MINGFNLGVGIANFSIATMIWFSSLSGETSSGVAIFLFILIAGNYALAVWNFSEAFKKVEKGVTNGKDNSKKHR